MSGALPILYSFRRCPYAMRARMAVRVAEQTCELREVVLRDKPPSMIKASPKATVPVLVLPDGKVIDESFDIMLWALKTNDPENWLEPEEGTLAEIVALIEQCEDEFKPHLDRYKYTNRYEDAKPEEHRAKAEVFLLVLEERLCKTANLFGEPKSLADFAIAPFIRQFANTDREWFDASPYPAIQRWLGDFLASEAFTAIMLKIPQWHTGDESTIFPVSG
jgi:glutathione S-transferase